MEELKLDLVIDHDFERLAGWVRESNGLAEPWRVTNILPGDDESLRAQIRSALRTDPDALVVPLERAPSAALIEMLEQTGLTGHAVFFHGATAEALAALQAGLQHCQAESGVAFLARVPEARMRVELVYMNLDAAPRQADLEDGFDRYECYSKELPAEAPPIAEMGDGLGLKVVEVNDRYDWEAQGTVEVVPVLADGPDLQPFIRAPLPRESWPLVEALQVKVADRHYYDNDDPPYRVYRLLLDVPAWVGALAKEGTRSLTRVGRYPVVSFRA